MKANPFLTLAVAIVVALLPAVAVAQQVTPTSTPPPPTDQQGPIIEMPEPGGTVQLYPGCNNIALTFPDGTPSETVVQAVIPTVASPVMWRYNAAQNRFEGYSPAALQASDLLTVNFLDAVWLCVSGPSGPSHLTTYTNADYGFSFRYPSTWQLEQEPNLVKLSQGTLVLGIGCRFDTEDVSIGGTGTPAGDFETRGNVTFLGQELRRDVLVFEGNVKAVFYVGTGPIQAGNVVFAIRLDDFSDDPGSDIPESLQTEVDQIVESFESTQ